MSSGPSVGQSVGRPVIPARLAQSPAQGLLTRCLGGHPLFRDLHRDPALLLYEIAWRWCCGGCLGLLAGFEAWRIWTAALPALRGTGLLLLTPDSLLADPAQLTQDLFAAIDILRVPVERAMLGLAPLAVFCWVLAFAWGRTGVLVRFDARLPRRRWMLAESEALRITGLLALAAAWVGLIGAARVLTFSGEDGHIWLYAVLVLAVTVGVSRFTGRFRRSMHIATVLALVEDLEFFRAFARAWRMGTHTGIVPLRRAVGRVRFYLFLAALLLAFVPAPFHFSWLLMGWWLLWSLPPLAAADAWQLGAFFAVVHALQVTDALTTAKAKP